MIVYLKVKLRFLEFCRAFTIVSFDARSNFYEFYVSSLKKMLFYLRETRSFNSCILNQVYLINIKILNPFTVSYLYKSKSVSKACIKIRSV